METQENQKVIYCEMLTLSEPIEIEMSLKDALNRFDIKLKALQNYLFKDMCFLGIKDLKGVWIKQN